MDFLHGIDIAPLYGIALISSDSVNGQKLIFRYPVNFCGPQVMPLFFSKGDMTGWKRLAQLFKPFSKSKDIVVSIGDSLSMIPRCIINGNTKESGESSAFVIVLFINNRVVESDFFLESFEDFTTKLAMSLLKEESRTSYLLEEKNLLLSIFNQYKQSVRSGTITEQCYLNMQLECSQLARELSQIYHEINHFHHTTIRIHNFLPFHYTIPTKRKPYSCVEFFTSEQPVCEKNIELYYSVLLHHPPSYFLQAEKCSEDSFLGRFVHTASPFLTLEAMSVVLNVPVEKVFAQALSLQAANTATILMCITRYTHFILAPKIDIESKALIFEAQFKALGSLKNLLAMFSISASIGDLFPQFNYSPLINNPHDLVLYQALTWLLQCRLILPVAIHCQYFPNSIASRLNEEDMKEGGHQRVHSQPLHHVILSPKANDSTPEIIQIHSDLRISSRLKDTPLYPKSFLLGEGMNNHLGSCGSFSRFSPDHEHSQTKNRAESFLSTPSIRADTKSPQNTELIEKCLPLMKDHYCVDEMCYLLNISHSDFYDMVKENPHQFVFYYVIRNM